MSLMFRAAQAMVTELNERMVAQGYENLRPAHGAVFQNIDVGDDGTRLVDLAERAQMTPQSMSELVNSLASMGYLERIPDPADGRAKRIRLTKLGHEAGMVAVGHMVSIDAKWLAWLGLPADGETHQAFQQALLAGADEAAFRAVTRGNALAPKRASRRRA